MLALSLALAGAGLDIVQRWLSARIAEGLIFDLRSALFDHVQGMPLAFFTRTQTGSLISRMNNDVMGAQQAFTGTLGSVLQNVLDVTVTLVVMLRLEWRLTVLVLVVFPLFVLPAKRVGRQMQRLTREAFQLDAAMNASMTERFNVSGALLVKLFGRPAPGVGRVRRAGRPGARHRHPHGHVRPGLLLGPGPAWARRARRPCTGTAPGWSSPGAMSLGTLVALAAYVARIYSPADRG